MTVGQPCASGLRNVLTTAAALSVRSRSAASGGVFSSMLKQGPEMAALIQTRLTLVVAMEAGHNPVKATGLLFAYLEGICQRTRPEVPQVWTLSAANRPPRKPWDFLTQFAEHNHRDTDDVCREFKLTATQLAADPLAETRAHDLLDLRQRQPRDVVR